MRTTSDDIRTYDECRDNLSERPLDDELITASSLTDDRVESLLASAIRTGDAEMVDLCETVLKQIVQPNLKQQALESIAELLNDAQETK